MKGSYRIVAKNSFVRYDFEIRRNITIIKGDSATGKTTLVDMVREYYENGIGSGIEIICDRTCTVLEGRNWKALLATMKECIIFIDEGNSFVRTTEFARSVQKSDNYYVIVSREGLENLPYSVEEIYGIRNSGKYATIKQTYNELYRIYGSEKVSEKVIPTKIIVEDANAGYEFYRALAENKEWIVESAEGKSNIFGKVIESGREERILVIADGAAFGAEMERMMLLLSKKKNIVLYLPESFEWLILKSDVLNDKEVRKILHEVPQYVESAKYFSWERYFTALLIEKTKDTYLTYTKKKLNPTYLQEHIQKKVCMQMEGIEL